MSEQSAVSTVHQPVLLQEIISVFQSQENAKTENAEPFFLDCTLGGGGHALALLNAHPIAHLCALDRDASALARARVRLAAFAERVTFSHGSFLDLQALYSERYFDVILADLGTSMDQLKGARGFSFNDAAALDMRMDESQELSAKDVVNTYEERALKKVLQVGGCGSEAASLARAIVRARPFLNAKQLAEVINAATPPAKRSGTGQAHTHPATVPFQAIRIEVNDELSQIRALLKAIPLLIKLGGRCAVITFHSLEDKLVTHTMRRWEQGGERSSVSRVTPTEPSLGRLLSKKAIVASDTERAANPASRSARLRVFQFHTEAACQQF